MKKITFVLFFLVLTIVANAQLKVSSSGRVTIGNHISTAYPLSIRGLGSSYSFYMNTYTGGGAYMRLNYGGGSTRYGLNVQTNLANDTTTYGIYVGQSHSSNQRAYGVVSVAGKSTNRSIGVFGTFSGGNSGETTKGAGIFGSTTGLYNSAYGLDALYAGYFSGDVRVTGTLYGTLLTPSSSSNNPSQSNMQRAINISSMEDESVTEKLQQVQLLQFYRSPDENKLSDEEIQEQKDAINERKKAKQSELATMKEDGSMATLETDDEIDEEIITEVPQTKLATIRYGLAADQLKAVYPELVYEDVNGNVSINYIEMIPLLVQAINEVKTENSRLKSALSEIQEDMPYQSKSRKSMEIASSINTEDEAILSLSQNNPNPFSTSTSIEVSVPEYVKTAALFVFDMSGKQIKCIDITERDISRIPISSEGLTEGMYLYSLIADGKVVGTKKMILVK